MHPMINTAIKAAQQASQVILQSFDRLSTLTINEKRHNDFVTDVDLRAEEKIVNVLSNAYPHHKIITEENGIVQDGDAFTWIIDPLDGTTNYIHGIPHFAVSLAATYKGKIEHAVIYDPIRQEWFTATRGSGAQLNNRRIRVSQQRKLDHALLGTGFPFRELQHFKPYMNIFSEVFPQTAGIRRAGSAALDLAYVAAGRFDGFWEMSLKPWDMAAGALLINEAGGMVSDFNGGDLFMDQGHIVAGNPKIHKALLEAIQDNLEN